MSAARLRILAGLQRRLRVPARSFSTPARELEGGDQAGTLPSKKQRDPGVPEQTSRSTPPELMQAPNRAEVWAVSQNPRSKAKSASKGRIGAGLGPREEAIWFSDPETGAWHPLSGQRWAGARHLLERSRFLDPGVSVNAPLKVQEGERALERALPGPPTLISPFAAAFAFRI